MIGVKIIALDLDDTLFRSDLSISKRTRNIVRKVMQSGITVVIATGRMPDGLLNADKLLGLNKTPGYLICGNGTLTIDSIAKTIINKAMLSPRVALAAFDLIDAEGFSVQIYDGNHIYVSRRNEFSNADYKLTGKKQIVPKDFRALLAEKGTNKIVVPADPVLLGPLEEILRNVMDSAITLFTSKPYFLEILPPACDKGAALARVAESIGVKREEVMAFGDSMNDESMLRWAGYGVAMCNGDERIKKAARFVTEKSNDDDGIAEFIERYVLAGEPLGAH
ncbi:MAG: Cof-type HAD-IIB family hydrolase [Spirochaetaceae bacterium]|jgi:Cof subfamily protein (haloacid dehalogenase superfamily)|nr:Cof-type HAD-IIB family hydrolase [Spirochaetaceae bacterium]